MTIDLDPIDLQLMHELQSDAKASLNRLGRAVGLSAPSVMERIRKLEQADVITGYSALVDARRIGLDITAFIGVAVNYPDRIQEFKEWVAGEPHVLECHHVTGGYTLLLKIKCRNTEALEQIISTMRSQLAVERTETMVALSTSAERIRLPFEGARAAAKARRRKSTRA